MSALVSNLPPAAALLGCMVLLALLESAFPLRDLGAGRRAHLPANLALTLLGVLCNAALGTALALALTRVEAAGVGLLPALSLPPLAHAAAVLLALDLSFYLSHVAMHRVPFFWRFHRVHHSDAAVDVTTAIRQHPGEALIRYAGFAAFALPLGASPTALLLHRLALALSALLEHANLRVPARVERRLALVFTWPNVHKVHHARERRFTDSNYGNLFSWWDRLFGTFTPSQAATAISYGLDGLDEPRLQTVRALLALPFRREAQLRTRPRNRRSGSKSRSSASSSAVGGASASRSSATRSG